MLREKREQIEGELYRFTSTITQELKNSRDVLSMLEHYKENAGEMFRRELDIVCADMRVPAATRQRSQGLRHASIHHSFPMW